MKNPISIGKKHYVRAALMLPVICLAAFTGCSSLDATAGNQTANTNRVGAYLEQNQEKPDNQLVNSDPDPTYKWFY
jgi:hypothetical protein